MPHPKYKNYKTSLLDKMLLKELMPAMLDKIFGTKLRNQAIWDSIRKSDISFLRNF